MGICILQYYNIQVIIISTTETFIILIKHISKGVPKLIKLQKSLTLILLRESVSIASPTEQAFLHQQHRQEISPGSNRAGRSTIRMTNFLPGGTPGDERNQRLYLLNVLNIHELLRKLQQSMCCSLVFVKKMFE